MKGFAIQLEQEGQVLRPVFRIVRNSEGKITNGLQIGPTQAQNEALILISNPGEFKNSPTLGVGLGNALLGSKSDMLSFRHEVRRCYRLEGLEIEKLNLYDISNIKIEAKYK